MRSSWTRQKSPSLLARTLAIYVREIAMTVEYLYDKESRVIHAHPGKCLSSSSMLEYFDKIITDNDIEPGFVEVVHFDEVKEFNYSSNEALLVTDLIKKLLDKKDDKGAVIIAKSDHQYAMARMLSTFLEDYFPVAIVRSENKVKLEIDKLHG